MKIKKSTLKQIIKEEIQNYATENNLDESIMDRIKGMFGRGKKKESPAPPTHAELFRQMGGVPKHPTGDFRNSMPVRNDEILDVLVRKQGRGDPAQHITIDKKFNREILNNLGFKYAPDSPNHAENLGAEIGFIPVADYTGLFGGKPGFLKWVQLGFARTANKETAKTLETTHKGFMHTIDNPRVNLDRKSTV